MCNRKKWYEGNNSELYFCLWGFTTYLQRYFFCYQHYYDNKLAHPQLKLLISYCFYIKVLTLRIPIPTSFCLIFSLKWMKKWRTFFPEISDMNLFSCIYNGVPLGSWLPPFWSTCVVSSHRFSSSVWLFRSRSSSRSNSKSWTERWRKSSSSTNWRSPLLRETASTTNSSWWEVDLLWFSPKNVKLNVMVEQCDCFYLG